MKTPDVRSRGCTVVIVLVTLIGSACGTPTDAPEPQPAARSTSPTATPASLAAPGASGPDFPDGPGQEIARQTCLACHSADLSLQQRLTDKQWTAVIDKMIRWGTALPDDRKAELVAYLARHFGPDNDRFVPMAIRPVGK